MPRNKVDSQAYVFTETTSASRPILKRKLAVAHEQFLIFLNYFLLKALGRTGYIFGRIVNLTGAYIYADGRTIPMPEI